MEPHADTGSHALEALVMGLLIPGPQHGYHLYQEYESSFGAIWKIGRSKFYAVLKDLHNRGRLEFESEVSPDTPPRKVYHLKESGRVLFMDWVYQPVKPIRKVRVEFLAKLRFFDLLLLPEPNRLILAQRMVCEDEIRRWEVNQSNTPTDPFLLRVYDFRIRQARFVLDWLEVL